MSELQIMIGVTLFAIAMLLTLILKFKLHPFVSLLLASIVVGLGCGMSPVKVAQSIQSGMGGALGLLAVIVGLGAMFGRMIEISGGAERMARDMVGRFGDKNAQWALGLTGFLISIPVFLDVGLIIVMPLVISLAKKTGKNILYYGIPLLAGLAVTHSFVPPTPGPIAAAQELDANLGWVILFGFIAGLPAMIVAGPLFARFISKHIEVNIPYGHDFEDMDKETKDLPSLFTTLGLILLPLLLILMNSILTTMYNFKDLEAENAPGYFLQALVFIGHPIVSMIIATILAFIILGKHKGLSADQVQSVATKALEPVGIIILITGAGGVFKQMLKETGIADQIGELMRDSNMNLIVFAFLLSTFVRIAQGSAMVTMLTAGAIMKTIIPEDMSEPMRALIVISIASGATILSHVNDSGFWLVSRYFGLSVKDTLKSWTVMETIIALIGFVTALLLSFFF